MADGFSKEDLEKIKQYWDSIYNVQAKASQSLKSYGELIKDIKEAKRQINYLDQQGIKLEREITSYTKEQKKLEYAITNGLSKNIKKDKERLEILTKQIDLSKAQLNILNESNKKFKEQTQILVDVANNTNKMGVAFKSLGKGVSGVSRKVWDMRDGFLNQVKDVRKTEMSMGILSNQADAFRTNIYKASLNTNLIGVGTKELAQMQASYSEQVGRSVQLSQSGLEAMAGLSTNTALGVDGAAELVSNMDSFGISVKGSKKLIEGMMDDAHKMGLNSDAVIKNLQKNIKLANRYHFKDGVKGLTRMAQLATKFKVDMEGIASMADKAFRPEGAVEMAAELQTMGGEFAKIADPFSLMFKARNDFEGFTKDIVNATKEMTTFNEKTGEFEFSGLQLDRMKEIARITGISSEQLAEMSKASARFEKVSSQMNTNLSIDNKEFLESMATFNNDTKIWEAVVNGQKLNIKDITDKQLDNIVQEKKNLEQRAKQSQTFDDKWTNITNSLKATFLPLVEELDKTLSPVLNDLTDWLKNSNVLQHFSNFTKTAGQLAGSLIKWTVENPFKALLGFGLFEVGKWILNGKMLRLGFDMDGKGLGGGLGGNIPMGRGGATRGKGGRMPRAGGLKGMGGSLAKGMKGFGIGSVLGLGLDLGREFLPEDYQEGHTGKIMGVGSNIASWAGTGALLGSMFGPAGTLVGGIAGGIGGGAYGLYDEYFRDKSGDHYNKMKSFDDVIVRAGQAPIGISPSDDIIAAKKDGPIDKVIGNANASTSTNGVTQVKFETLKIDGKIEVVSGSNSHSINLDDPILLREISRFIQMELSKSINGGRISSNPA